MPVIPLILDATSEAAHCKPCDHAKQREANESKAIKGDLLAHQHAFGVGRAGDETFFAKCFFKKNITQEVGSLSLPDFAFGQLIDADTNRFGKFGVERSAFPHG